MLHPRPGAKNPPKSGARCAESGLPGPREIGRSPARGRPIGPRAGRPGGRPTGPLSGCPGECVQIRDSIEPRPRPMNRRIEQTLNSLCLEGAEGAEGAVPSRRWGGPIRCRNHRHSFVRVALWFCSNVPEIIHSVDIGFPLLIATRPWTSDSYDTRTLGGAS